MTEFTPWASLGGGALIGVAAVLLMALHGRIAGLSGILTGAIMPSSSDRGWRLAFLFGAILAPMLLINLAGIHVAFESTTPLFWLAVSGILVGIGISFGGGCTSGHGVCGLARLSMRSLVATITFMITTAITVYVIRHVLGGF